MQSKELVIQKLKEVRDKIPEIKAQGLPFRDTVGFSDWRDTGTKWLKQGGAYTKAELWKFEHVLHFAVSRVREGPDDYDYEDQEEYEKDCDRAASILNSAIENLEMELEPPKEEARKAERGPRSKYGGVTITEVDTVVIGEGNVLNIDKSITISDFLNVLEKEIEAKVTDAEQKKGLLQKLKEISQNPAANTVMGQALGAILRGAFGG